MLGWFSTLCRPSSRPNQGRSPSAEPGRRHAYRTTFDSPRGSNSLRAGTPSKQYLIAAWSILREENDADGSRDQADIILIGCRTSFDKHRELVERHPPTCLVVSGRQAGRQPVVNGDQIGAAVSICERDRNRHFPAQRGIRCFELVHLDHLLVRHHPYEAAMVGVSSCCRLAGS